MLLDLNQSDQQLAARFKPNEGTHIPATTGEGFEAAWNESRLFSASTASGAAQLEGLYDYRDEVLRRTGRDLAPAMNSLQIGGDWTALTDEVKKLKGAQPDLDIADPSLDEINRRGEKLSREARRVYHEQAAGEGGGLGRFLGGLASAATDPVNLVAAPFGGGEAGVLVTALKFGGLAAASQVANEALQANFRERVQPGYAASGEPAANILEAGASGFILGGGTKALGNAWTRVKTGAWPTSVRDAGNMVESEAHTQQTNVYQGAAGEAAHRDALASATDQIIKGEPVSVEHIITPEIEAGSRGIMARLEGEHAMALPIFDERAIRLTSEEAALRTRAAELEQHAAALPQGDVSAADRLNRLAVVERQLADAGPAARKTLLERRDQILVDTTPEALRAAAAPIEARRAAEAERAGITARLAAIGEEREPTPAQPMLGQREPVRVPFEQIRAATKALTEAAAAEKAAPAGPAPELPFEATPTQAQAETAAAALRNGITQIAESGGHVLSPEEVSAIAERLARAGPEEAADALRDIKVSPRQLAAQPFLTFQAERKYREIEDALIEAVARGDGASAQGLREELANQSRKIAAIRQEIQPEPLTARSPEEAAQMLASPDHEAALRSDIDRARATGDVKIPSGVDPDGNPVFRSLDAALDEVDGFKKAADEIQACAAPVREAAE